MVWKHSFLAPSCTSQEKESRHFTDIGPNLASQINPPRVSFRDFVESCDSTFELELLTTDELRKLVNDIPVGKADGLNGIPTSLLKLSFTFIASSSHCNSDI